MSLENSQLVIVDSPKLRCCNWTYWAGGLFCGIAFTFLLGIAFWAGRQSASTLEESTSWNDIPRDRIHPDLLSATSTHGGTNMAVCTAAVGDDAEGFFTLDYITGDLRGWVYYPRQGAFGGMFATNVKPQLGESKNPEYLLVSGYTAAARLGGNVRLAQSLIYVVDTRSGYFCCLHSAMEQHVRILCGRTSRWTNDLCKRCSNPRIQRWGQEADSAHAKRCRTRCQESRCWRSCRSKQTSQPKQ